MGRPPASPKPGGMVQKRYQWIVLPKQTWQGNGLDGGSREGEDKELVQCSGSNRLIATLTIELDSLGWSQRWLRPSRLLSYCFLKRGDLLRRAFKTLRCQTVVAPPVPHHPVNFVGRGSSYAVSPPFIVADEMFDRLAGHIIKDLPN